MNRAEIMKRSSTAETRATIERMYAAAQAGDLAAVSEVMHEQVVVHEPPFLPYGGTYTGLNEFTGVYAEAAAVIDLAAVQVESLTVEDDRAFAVVTVPLVADATPISLVEHWTVAEGKITSGRIFWFDRLNNGE